MIPKSGMYCWGPVTFMHERIVLPNSMPIIYPGIRNTSEGLIHEQILGKGTAKSFRRIWGGLLMENICQALARIIITTAELKLARAGLQSVLQVHDELVYVVPEIMAEKVAKVVAKVMTTQVPWLPALPVACEVGIGDCYGNAK
jgi:DNA polymerase